MSCKIIGFVGIDMYDLIVYSAKLLVQLDYRVLLIDKADSCALTCCVSIPEEHKRNLLDVVWNTERAGNMLLSEGEYKEEEQGIVSYIESNKEKSLSVLSYNDIDFVEAEQLSHIDSIKEEYDYVFITSGYTMSERLSHICDRIFLCTDQQLHHIYRMVRGIPNEVQKIYLLFQKLDGYRVNSNYVLAVWNINLLSEHIFEYVIGEKDKLMCLDCQYHSNISLKGLSKTMKDCIKYVLQVIGVWDSSHHVKQAYRRKNHWR